MVAIPETWITGSGFCFHSQCYSLPLCTSTVVDKDRLALGILKRGPMTRKITSASAVSACLGEACRWRQGNRAPCDLPLELCCLDERQVNSNMAEGWILDPGVSLSEPWAIALSRRLDRDLPAMFSRLDHTLALVTCFDMGAGEFRCKLDFAFVS